MLDRYDPRDDGPHDARDGGHHLDRGGRRGGDVPDRQDSDRVYDIDGSEGRMLGHLSRRKLKRYSHIRIDAKRQVLDALDEARRGAESNGGVREDGVGHTDGYALTPPPNGAAVPLVVALAGPTSQSPSQFAFGGIAALR